MANVNAPFGFAFIGNTDGSVPNFGMYNAKIAYNNTNKIFRGDLVKQLNTGYIDVSAAGQSVAYGVFWGCRYYSTSRQIPFFSKYWPGSDATGDVDAYIITNPTAQFVVQSSGQSSAAATFAMVGQNMDIYAGTAGSTTSGLSGMTVNENTVNTTNTFPFRVMARYSQYIAIPGSTAPSAFNGADDTTPYNWLVVAFNNTQLKTGQTGV
jgi:hypothetical protein